jgi:hypothetical protein
MEDRGLGEAMARGAKREPLLESDLATAPDGPLATLQHEVETHLFVDDGVVPNNSKLPLILYRHALALDYRRQARTRLRGDVRVEWLARRVG